MRRGLRHFTSLSLRTSHRPAISARETHVEMGAKLNALVIGGSIGGLSTAHALLRAGCGVTVLERAPEVSGNSLGAVSHSISQKQNRKHIRMFVKGAWHVACLYCGCYCTNTAHQSRYGGQLAERGRNPHALQRALSSLALALCIRCVQTCNIRCI